MGCAGSKPPTAPETSEPDRIFELKHCGVRAVNGWYVRDGVANGHPQYKHESAAMWVRVNAAQKKWTVTPANTSSASICIYKIALDKRSPTLPPAGNQWALGTDWSKERAERDGWADGYKTAQKHSRWPTPNAPLSLTQWKQHVAAAEGTVTLSGAGWASANGTYVRDGVANGAPKFKHTEGELWIRHSTTMQHWVVTPKDGSAAWTTLYYAAVHPKRPHVPPTDGWRLGKNWSVARATEDGWHEVFAAVQSREPPPSSSNATGLSAAAPIVLGTLLDDADDSAPVATVSSGSGVGGSSRSSGLPPLAEMATLVKRELGIEESASVKEVLERACVELDVSDAADLTLLDQAEACYLVLVSMD